MKNFILTLVVVLLPSMSMWAYDFSATNGDGVTIYYNIVNEFRGKYCEVTYRGSTYNSSISYSGDVKIPQTVVSTAIYTVVGIGKEAFRGCSELTSVTLPDSITTIGDYAFYSCSALTGELKIPETVTSIGKSAFGGCSGFTGDLKIPDGVSTIEAYAFSGCSGLTSINFSEGVTTINGYAFKNCTGLTELTIPKNIIDVRGSAFDNCTNLKKLTLEDGEEKLDIVRGAFNNCPIETLYCGRAITSYAFYEMTTLTSLTIGSEFSEIRQYTFYGCTGLTELTIPKNITLIDGWAFDNCTNLKKLTLEDGDEELNIITCKMSAIETLYLGRNVSTGSSLPFKDITTLTSLTIGEHVTQIVQKEFYGCTNLSGDLIIPNSVTAIGDYAFYKCENLNSFTGGNSVTTIGSYAFAYCYGLTTINIGNSVISIGGSAFAGCAIEELTIPSNVMEIGEYAFSPCSSLKSVTIEDSEEQLSVSPYIFGRYPSVECPPIDTLYLGRNISQTFFRYVTPPLHSLTIGNMVTQIPSEAFSGGSFPSVIIPNSVTTIGGDAFGGCHALTEIIIGNGVTEIGSEAFSNCDALTEVNIPNGVTEIGYGAFSGCDALTSVIIGNGVTSIGKNAFYKCWELASLTLGNSVKDIKKYAFYDTGLTGELIIPNSVTEIEAYAFYNGNGSRVTSITSAIIGSSVTQIGDEAFGDCGRYAESVYSLNPEPPSVYAQSLSLGSETRSTCVLYVPIGSYEAYSTARTWKEFRNIVEMDFNSALYDVLYDEIGLIQGLLSDAWYTIKRECPYAVEGAETDHGALKEELANLIVLLQDALKNGTLDDEFADDIRAKLEEIKQKIEKLLVEAEEEQKILGIDDTITPPQTKEIIGYYTINGMKINASQKGINIIRYSDGTTRKVIVN